MIITTLLHITLAASSSVYAPTTASAASSVGSPTPAPSLLPLPVFHPHPPCCPACPNGPCTSCRTPGPVPPTCCPCLPDYPPEPPCVAPDSCTNLTSARGYGASFGMLNDLMVFAGGFKGNLGGDRIDILNSTDRTWRQAKMSANRTLFAGAALEIDR